MFQQKNQPTYFGLITKYKKFFFFLLGFGFAIAGATSLSTYLINIVKKLGEGDSSFYSIAIFFMAASETPFMTMTYRLKKDLGLRSLLFLDSLCISLETS